MKTTILNLLKSLWLLRGFATASIVSQLLSLSSCGYQVSSNESKTTISIPYISGDKEGQLTAELTRQITASNLYELASSHGDLTLQVSIVGDRNDIVGFRYDRSEESGKLEKNLMATENRRLLSALVTIVDRSTGETVIGPLTISGSGDYDYIDVTTLRELAFITPSGKTEKVINFSLGQLDSIEGAQDGVLTPVYAQLASRIIAAIERAGVSKKLS